LSARNAEIGDRRVALAARRHRGPKLHRVRACGGEQRAFDPMDPWSDDAIVEAHHEIHAHRHPTANALDDAHDVQAVRPQRHAIDEPDRAVFGVDFGFEDQRVIAITAPHRARATDRRNPKMTVAAAAQQRGKARRAVELRHAQPIDRPVARDECGGPHVAYQRVVFDVRRHGTRSLARRGRRFSRGPG
jgi:hypothetical protein